MQSCTLIQRNGVMADYNVMLGLELESDAIQKIENRIKNIKCALRKE